MFTWTGFSILSMIKSLQHKLARFLNSSLEPVLTYYFQFVVKDSFEMIERIKNVKSNNTVLTSYGVKQLFKNVPLKESIKVSVDISVRLRGTSKPE